jgi:error-prone DNA polymerase
LLNSQPMGFYAPAQLVRVAREHAVEVRAVDIAHSQWDSSLEKDAHGRPAIRLGLRLVKGLSGAGAERLCAARALEVFVSVQDLALRARLDKRDLGALAAAGALKSLAEHRHRARWQVAGVEKAAPLLAEARYAEGIPLLRRPTEGEEIAADYRRLGLSLGRHPLALLRARLATLGVQTAAAVRDLPNGTHTCSAGLVITRQRPSSAAGVTFVTVEDESGYLNLIVWERLAERVRKTLVGAALLGFKGTVQKEHDVVHVIAERLYDHSFLLGGLTTSSRDFR